MRAKLRLDDLSVETFVMGSDVGLRGTVDGHNGDGGMTRPSQDVSCTLGDDQTDPCGPCGDAGTGWGYTCDRPSCMQTCMTKYPCILGGDESMVMTMCNGKMGCPAYSETYQMGCPI